ncbi:phytoene desaturase family protein [Geomicrobium sediminis]|uniref:Phytoene desaturase n=1 Tax=Geomicrobium sediminis TaxID=1347788 RepID=A0ABS2PE51_9BACL|nr:phytoene desaturase family protein [Geomicrobium sediminis]MBM7633614.1 phytoene desaturase [Geomicrobium sediminis]
MKTAIIGGGIGGMMTALNLTKEDLTTRTITIYEKDERLGGRLRYKERDGYKVDEGPTIVLLPNLLISLLESAGIDCEQLDMLRCDPLYALHYEDGQTFYKWSDEQLQMEEIKRHYPGEEEGYKKYMTVMKENFNSGKEAFLDQAFVDRKQFFTLENTRKLLKMHVYESMNKTTSRYFKSKRLQEAFSFQSLYIGGNPKATPALYSLIPYSEHADGIWYVRGGYAKLAQILQQELERRGVTIKLKTAVKEVITEGNVATGIVEEHGGLQHFDEVIVNGDLPMMDRLFTTHKTKRTYEPSSGCLLIYAGVDGAYDEQNIHQFFMSNEHEQHMNDVFKEKKWHNNPSFYLFNPSMIDDTLAPAGKSVLYFLVPAPVNETLDNEAEYVERVLQRAEQQYEGLRERIEWFEVKTPQDAALEGLFAGGSFGIAPSYKQSGVFRPQFQPYAYKNVYAVGASIHPGGGIPIVMQGAQLLVDHLLTKEMKERRSHA